MLTKGGNSGDIAQQMYSTQNFRSPSQLNTNMNPKKINVKI